MSALRSLRTAEQRPPPPRYASLEGDEIIPAPGARPQTSYTVLVVDDDPDQVSLLSRFLSLHGIEAVPAYSGPQCLQLVQQRTIDVIVLNVEMPQMNGLEVCRTLKKQKASRAIPIIILTARDDPKTQRTALKRGASKFVSKPARGQEVLACIRAQLEKSRKET